MVMPRGFAPNYILVATSERAGRKSRTVRNTPARTPATGAENAIVAVPNKHLRVIRCAPARAHLSTLQSPRASCYSANHNPRLGPHDPAVLILNSRGANSRNTSALKAQGRVKDNVTALVTYTRNTLKSDFYFLFFAATTRAAPGCQDTRSPYQVQANFCG